MSGQWTERELKRMSREMAGRARDKDRARRKRRASSVAPAPRSSLRRPDPERDDDPLDDGEDGAAEG